MTLRRDCRLVLGTVLVLNSTNCRLGMGTVVVLGSTNCRLGLGTVVVLSSTNCRLDLGTVVVLSSTYICVAESNMILEKTVYGIASLTVSSTRYC